MFGQQKTRLFLAALLLIAIPSMAQDESLVPDGDDSSDSGTTCDTTVAAVVDEGTGTPAGNCGAGGSGADCCRADSNNVSWTFDVTMPTPSSALNTGSDVQVMKIHVESFDEGQAGDPTIRIDILDGTACADLHETGATTTLTDAGFPAVISDSWTAAGLSGAADVCVRIVCTKIGGASGARNSCDIDAIEWDVFHAAAGGARRRTSGNILNE